MITIPQRVLGEALIFSARNWPSKTAAVIKSKEYSYSALKKSAESVARHLVFSGIKKGDRVAVYMNNSWQSIVSIYGITLAGAAFLVINPQTKGDKLHYILKDSVAKILITESLQKNELISTLDDSSDIEEVIITGDISAISGLTKVASVDFEEALLTGANTSTILPKAIPNDLAALIYTSGSTGFPKGVMMTHQSMVFTSWSLIAVSY